MSGYLFIVDAFKAKDNVLRLSGETLTIASVSPDEANRLAISGEDAPADLPHWTIPVRAVREIKGLPTGLEVTYLDDRGRSARFDHRADRQKQSEFLAAIQDGAEGEWLEETSHESRWTGFLIFFGSALLFAAITAFFHFGIEAGWVQRAPSFVAAIYNILGPKGILAAGGLLVAVCLFFAVKSAIYPAPTTCLKRR